MVLDWVPSGGSHGALIMGPKGAHDHYIENNIENYLENYIENYNIIENYVEHYAGKTLGSDFWRGFWFVWRARLDSPRNFIAPAGDESRNGWI